MPEPITMSVTTLAGTGVGLVVVNKLFDLLLTKWKNGSDRSPVDCPYAFTRDDQKALHDLHDAHMVNATDEKGRYRWWGGETTDAVKENTKVLREVRDELKRQNGSRTR